MDEACPACGRWRCSNCGHTRSLMNRFSAKPHYCPQCGSKEGEMLPTVHRLRRYQDHTVEMAQSWKTTGPPQYPLEGYDYSQHLQ